MADIEQVTSGPMMCVQVNPQESSPIAATMEAESQGDLPTGLSGLDQYECSPTTSPTTAGIWFAWWEDLGGVWTPIGRLQVQ